MEEIQKRLSKLTIEELRAELKSSGQKPIPITKTTRTLVERRIAKYLWEKEGGGEEKGSEKGPSDVSREDLAEGVLGKKAEELNRTASTHSMVLIHWQMSMPSSTTEILRWKSHLLLPTSLSFAFHQRARQVAQGQIQLTLHMLQEVPVRKFFM